MLGTADQVYPNLSRMFINAQLRQFNEAMRHSVNDLSQWPRRGMEGEEHKFLESADVCTPAAMPNLAKDFGGPTQNYCKKIYWAVPRLIALGADCAHVNELKRWAQSAWPELDFTQFRCRN
jgi:hypothetical protein